MSTNLLDQAAGGIRVAIGQQLAESFYVIVTLTRSGGAFSFLLLSLFLLPPPWRHSPRLIRRENDVN